MRTVHVVIPEGVDDPDRPSGGNQYDRRVCAALAAAGWRLREYQVAGPWPRLDADALAQLARVLTTLPDSEPVLIDGLVASTAADVLLPESTRLRVVVLMHMPLGTAAAPLASPAAAPPAETVGEADVLHAAAAVVTTSAWTRDVLLRQYGLPPDHVHVARPGADPAEPAPGTDGGGELLCVAAVTPGKGHDVLVRALADVRDLRWRCWYVGSLHVDAAFSQQVRRLVEDSGLSGRVFFTGALTGDALAARYAAADLLVLATRGETYGMVVGEALAHGLPVLAAEVGGVPEALGSSPEGLPGLLVPPEDPAALAAALREWLGDPGLRRRLRHAAGARRLTLRGWADTAAELSRVLVQVTR